MERMEVGAMATTVRLRSVLRPDLRYIVPSHTVKVKTTKTKVTESRGDRKGRIKHNVKVQDEGGTLFVEEPGPAIVQFVDGYAEVDNRTWAAMARNGVAHGLGVVVEGRGPDDDDVVHLPRLSFAFDRFGYARLRQLIDQLNAGGVRRSAT